MKAFFSALALVCGTSAAMAQATAEPQFKISCQHKNWSGNKESEQFCETRDLTMDAAAGQVFVVDGGTNGGITVHGWAGPNVRVRAKVQSWGRTEAEAQSRVQSVRIATANNTLRASTTANDERYSVSYEIFVPRQTALSLKTLNGGISLDNLRADVKFYAVNGGVALADLGGQVTGQTVNGGLTIALTGRQWEGKGLDVETTNGGIRWQLPRDYSAQLFTSTDMGNLRTSLPITKSGFMHKEIAASLGKGGAPVKAVTTNGGIDIEQQGD
ncbi:DUF4097 family beta strand repeat-containing protein [Hymenobacter sp.]|uniref:DUF4097 family beta strand repeat-containing protein n=1 Tax=Hymenobacter sp. TaxID=1898978 RepID=UPI00286B1BD5|nr:DUF4097 family beta strand repeat-containing protein [Hymenobacter sp.]